MIMRADLDRPVAGIGDGRASRSRRPALSSMSPSSMKISPGIMRAPHRIGSCTVTSLVPSGNVASTWMSWIISAMPSITCARVSTWAPSLHQLGDAAAVARAFQDEIGDQRDRFGMVELDAALQPAARHHRGHGDQQLVLFARREIHGSLQFSHSRGSGAAPSAVSTRDQIVAQRRAIGGDAARDSKPVPGRDADFAGKIMLHARTAATLSSPPGISARSPSPRRPRRRPAPPELAAMPPSSRTVSAKTSLPPTRTRQRSKKRPESPSRPWPSGRRRPPRPTARWRQRARSTSIVRRSRARSNRIVSCGSQAERPAGTDSSLTSISVSGPSER